MRGRKPTPRAILKLRNAYRADRHGKPNPKPPEGVPRCPSWLDATGKACWKRVTGSLRTMGILSSADTEVLCGLAQNWSLFVRASKLLNKTTLDGSLQVRHLSATASDAFKNYSKACAEFGLTPSSRCRIDTTRDKSEPDELDRLLQGA